MSQASARIEKPFAPHSVSLQAFSSMPEDYRRAVIRIMSVQAYAERLGAMGVPGWIHKVPDFRAVRTLAKILADEARHAFFLYHVLERIGVPESEAVRIATASESTSDSLRGPASLTEEPEFGWNEMVMNCMFLDRAGGYMVENFSAGSFAPWADACAKIHRDETMHIAFGQTEFRRLAAKHCDEPGFASLVTHWFCAGLNFFGPPPTARHMQLAEWGIKRKDNNVLRDAYRAEVMQVLGKLELQHLVQLKNDAYPYA